MDNVWMAVASALITGLFSLLGVYLANRKSAALMEYRIQQLEQKQDVHNNMIERMYKVEGRITEAEHDILDLKGRKGNGQ